jgi:dTDP-4-amino-4,6-dideoxygalactose transaminase
LNQEAVNDSNALRFIPFNRFCKVGTEFGYIQEAIDRMHVSGDGYFTEKCRALLERELGASAVLLTTSCTHALEMAALLLEINVGDEVIVPSFTFVSTVNAFVLRGAIPVFTDIRKDT